MVKQPFTKKTQTSKETKPKTTNRGELERTETVGCFDIDNVQLSTCSKESHNFEGAREETRMRQKERRNVISPVEGK